MNKGFVIGQSNELIKDGTVYDLHNNYDLECVIYLPKTRELKIQFKPIPEFTNNGSLVSLIFNKTDYLEFSPKFGSQDISGLDEMGYKRPDDQDDEWLMEEKHSSPSDHMFISLDGSDYIRVHSQYADVIEA